MKILALSLLTTIFVACATSGREFPSNLNWIQKGKTKQDDVKLVLGAPQSVGSSSGQPTWTYGYYKFKLLGESHTKEVKLYWNPDGTVASYSFTSSFPDDVIAAGKTQGFNTPAQAPTSSVSSFPQPSKPVTQKPLSDVTR